MQLHQQQPDCINCKKHFELGQTLAPEGIHIEYKKYYLPIKDQQPKWILLKTIVAFLNSKGGTIFMGVDDSTRQVVGLTAELKQQDVFMLEFAQLLEQIKPEVDLRRKEEVKVRFVPVLKDKIFQGKYVIKIIVKQGDPSKVYHFAQTLKFQSDDKRSHDEEFKVLWGFYRCNMGRVDAIKGTELLRQVYEKATNPSIVVETYHPGCNPEPLQVSVRNMNIGFKNLQDPKLRQFIIDSIDKKFKLINLATTYTIDDIKQEDTFIIKFKSITDYKEADLCIGENSKEIKGMIPGKDSLIDEGYLDNTHFYKIGKEFNPSLRYLRNREKSRDKSIDVEKKIYKKYQQKDAFKGPLPPKPNQTPKKANSKAQEQKVKSPLPTDSQEFVKPKNQFIKNLPKDVKLQPSDEEDAEEDQSMEESPEKVKQSPVKQFKVKPEDFPQIPSNNLPPKPNNKQLKPSQPVTNIIPSSKKAQIEQSPQKESLSKRQKQEQTIEYSILFSDIFEPSYPKLVHYLENSLGNKLQRIPHKIQEFQNKKEIAIHFHSLKDVEAFAQGLSVHMHTRRVFHGFGEGKPVTMKIKKGSKIQDFIWAPQTDHFRQQSNEKNKTQSRQKPQSNSRNNRSKSRQIDSNSKSKPHYVPKPQSVEEKPSPSKSKPINIRGYPFVITNLRNDLSKVEKAKLSALLREGIKKSCNPNSKVQILNEKRFLGIVGMNFSEEEDRKGFSDEVQSSMMKNHDFTDFFKGLKMYWGVPSGNVILHHYKGESRKEFKEEVDRLFSANKQQKWINFNSKYVKQENKYFLRVSLHPSELVEGYEMICESVNQSPIKEYASWKEGIVVFVEMNRI